MKFKYKKIGVFLCGLCLGVFGAEAQINDNINPTTPGTDSLVHVAYGVVNKRDQSGAISVLNPSKYLDKNYGTYPLEGVNAFIGGSNLWNLGTSLVLIDGAPRSINDITAAEIDQVTFLKGANAVVLYGSRAANGAILITSKRGKMGHKSAIRVNNGISVPKAYPQYLGSAEYMTYYNQALKNDGLAPLYDAATIQNYNAHTDTYRYPDVNYFSSDYLRKFFNTTSANAEFSGGNDRARFYALAGYQNQNSLLKIGEGNNENNTRLNIRGNIDLKLNDIISTYVNVSAVFSTYRSALGNFWQLSNSIQPQRFSPLIPINLISAGATNANTLVSGSRNIIDGKYLLGGTQQYLTSPLADIYAGGYNVYTSRQFQYTSGIDVNLKKMLKGFSFHTQVNIDYSNTYNESVNNAYAIYVPTWSTGTAPDSITQLTMYNKDSKTGNQNLSNTFSDQLVDFNAHFDYKTTLKNRHNISAILVAAAMQRRMTGDFQYRTNANIGLQVAYNYEHKYYADFSGAVVNSTRLPANTRVGFSPTLSLGWLLSEEGFLKKSSVVNRLKLTASAGIVNTDLDIPINSYYLYNAVYAPTSYFSWADGTYTNRTSTLSRGENLNLAYAKRKEINIGIEGSFFHNKLDVSATAFSIKKDGIPIQSNTLYPSYFNTSYPPTSFVPYTNFGANSYKGFDFQINFHEKVGNLNLTIGAAGTFVTTKALKVDEQYADSYRNRTGRPTDAIFGLQSKGLFADQNDIATNPTQKFGPVGPGDIKYKDQNGDGIIDSRDEVMLGRYGSPFTGGLNITAQYKNFSLFVLGTGNFGGMGIKNNNYYWVSGATKYSAVVRDSWTPDTKNTATYPHLTTLGGGNDFLNSDFWTYNTDRLNLSKVQLTYFFPEKFTKKSFMKGLNIYVSGNDLLTISKNKAIMELNTLSTPQTRFYNCGIKAEF